MEYFSSCYSSKQIKAIEEQAFSQIEPFALMQRAGKEVFSIINKNYSFSSLLVFCGPGNNGGDGYIVAMLAKQAGFNVQVITSVEPHALICCALQAYNLCKDADVEMSFFNANANYQADLVIDAILGIGITRKITGKLAEMVSVINKLTCPVISVDVPTGIDSDKGIVHGCAVRATTTVTFIGNKRGLITADALDYVGELVVRKLGVPDACYRIVSSDGKLVDDRILQAQLRPRLHNTSKKDFGNVVIIGGDVGMAGAVVMAARAAMRAGCGSVKVFTHAQHATQLVNEQPEIMYYGVTDSSDIMLRGASVVVIGPGMGDTDWSENIWKAFSFPGFVIVDATALRWMAKYPKKNLQCIITPHPGEAAYLLNSSSKAIQQDRYAAAREITDNYECTTLLKGAGSIVTAPKSEYYVLSNGNPGMATAGMGDVLSGVIAAMVANGHSLLDATILGAYIHAKAGDIAAANHPKGLLATDLLDVIRKIINS